MDVQSGFLFFIEVTVLRQADFEPESDPTSFQIGMISASRSVQGRNV
jgi:hypothetical protein